MLLPDDIGRDHGLNDYKCVDHTIEMLGKTLKEKKQKHKNCLVTPAARGGGRVASAAKKINVFIPVFQRKKNLQLGRSIFVFKFNHKHYFILIQISCHLTTMKSTSTWVMILLMNMPVVTLQLTKSMSTVIKPLEKVMIDNYRSPNFLHEKNQPKIPSHLLMLQINQRDKLILKRTSRQFLIITCKYVG